MSSTAVFSRRPALPHPSQINSQGCFIKSATSQPPKKTRSLPVSMRSSLSWMKGTWLRKSWVTRMMSDGVTARNRRNAMGFCIRKPV